MKTLFVKDENYKATCEIQCLWVNEEDVTAHIKWDGSACMVKDDVLYKRYDAKRNRKTGEFKTPPKDAIPCCEPDEVTGHWPHWVRVSKSDKYHLEALYNCGTPPEGTYELCGPKVNSDKEALLWHILLPHTGSTVSMTNFKDDSGISYQKCFDYINSLNQEGIVFHHPGGRKCKLRRTDFGLSWPIRFNPTGV